MKYLLHQTRDGSPVGVFTETGHWYHPLFLQHESYGVAVMQNRGSNATWDEWIDQLAGKSPSPQARWDTYENPSYNLEKVLTDARNSITTD